MNPVLVMYFSLLCTNSYVVKSIVTQSKHCLGFVSEFSYFCLVLVANMGNARYLQMTKY